MEAAAHRAEPLLASEEDGPAEEGSERRQPLQTALLVVGLNMAFAALICVAMNSSSTGMPVRGAGSEEVPRPAMLASGPLGLGGALGPLGVVLRKVYDVFEPFSYILTAIGAIMFSLSFLLGGLKHGKDFKGYVDMMKSFGLPCPTVMAVGGQLCCFGGAICYLTCIPVLMEWGAELFFIFLIPATYYGHYKPWTEDKTNTTHFLMMLKNISMAGGCLLTIGFVVPLIGDRSGPVGLHGALGRLGFVLGDIYAAVKPYSYIFMYLGIVLFVQIFVFALVKFTADFQTFSDMMKAFGLPCPAVFAAGGLGFLLAGSLCFLTGIPVLMEWGAEFLCCFLLAATYFGHFKPWMQTGDFMHFLSMLKNISMMGVCLLTMGAVIPMIGAH